MIPNSGQTIRILNVEPRGYAPQAQVLLADRAQVTEQELSREALVAEIGAYDVLIVRLAHRIDRQVIDAGERLRVIVSATTGLDHIDVGYAASRGVTVLSLLGETEFLRGITATAEHTWALLLALVRRIVPASEAVRRGNWNRDAFCGRQMSGKRLSLVGLGRVGRQVARFGQAFEMPVAAYDPFIETGLDGVQRLPTLEALLQQSDILSLHVHLDRETKGMIGAEALALLPTGAVLINTARGAIVDETALLAALERGHLAGAALDVLADEGEQRAPISALADYAKTHDNVLITPHLGGATRESMTATELFMAQKLVTFLGTGVAQKATAS